MISVITRVYNDSWHILNCIDGYIDFVDEVVLIEGALPFVQERLGLINRRSIDNTTKVLKEYIKSSSQSYKIKYHELTTETSSEHHFPFWNLSSAHKDDYVLVVDSDEIYIKSHFEKIVQYIVKYNPTRLGVFSYNMINTEEYRSDSHNGPMPIGGRVVKYGKFNTDRNVEGDSCGPLCVVPGVFCCHFSLMKPLWWLKNKQTVTPEVKNNWVIKNGKPVFIDGTTILKYTGDLPDGYTR